MTITKRGTTTCNSNVNDNVSGISILTLLADVGVVADHVSTIGVRSSVLYPEDGDLDDPSSGVPFTDNVPPMLSVSNDDVVFFVNCRPVPSGRPGAVNDGLQASAAGGDLAVTVNLDGPLLRPEVAGPRTATAEQSVTFTGSLPPGSTPPGAHWSWNFGDSPNPDPQDTATPTHTFTTASGAGGYEVRATVTGTDGSSGLSAPFSVVVDPAGNETTSPPPSTTPTPTKTQTSAGVGAPTDPSAGPQTGSGPRSGGVPTDRAGTGAPGNSYDPRPSGAAATATAGTGVVQANGQVVGYALSDPTSAAEARQGARQPRDDSAPAARNGVESVRLAGWVVAVAVVAALLALGAGSERRRPTAARAGRRRTRPRRHHS